MGYSRTRSVSQQLQPRPIPQLLQVRNATSHNLQVFYYSDIANYRESRLLPQRQDIETLRPKSPKSWAGGRGRGGSRGVESYMGCGIGICQGCVIERFNENQSDHSYHEKYSLVCIDGPVYKSEEVNIA